MAHSSVDVEPGPDGLVPGDLGDDADCGVSEAAKIIHSNWLEPNSVGSAGSSDLPDFPGMSEACGVPSCSAPRAMASSRRDAVTQTSSARSSPPDSKGMSRSAGRLTNAMARKSTDGEVDCHLKEQLKACWKYKLELTTG